MKGILFCIAFCMISFGTFAQSGKMVEFEWQPINEDLKIMNKWFEYLGKADGDIYIAQVKWPKSKSALEPRVIKVNNNAEASISKIPYKDDDKTLVSMIEVGGKGYMIYSGDNAIFATEVQNGNLVGGFKKIAEGGYKPRTGRTTGKVNSYLSGRPAGTIGPNSGMEDREMWGTGLVEPNDNFKKAELFNVSPNGRFAVYMDKTFPKSGNDRTTFRVFVFDESFDVVWKQEFEMTKKDESEYLSLMPIVSDEGVVYFNTVLIPEKSSAGKSGFIYELRDGAPMKMSAFGLGNEGMGHDDQLTVQPDGSIILTGLTLQLEKLSRWYTGVYALVYKAGEILKTKATKFTDEQLSQLHFRSQPKPTKDIDFVSSYSLDNGDIIFHAEVANAARIDGITYYTTSTSVVPRFGPNGDLLSLNVISKKYKSATTKIGVSGQIILEGQNAYMLYNTDPPKELKGEGKKVGLITRLSPDSKPENTVAISYKNKDTDGLMFDPIPQVKLGDKKYLVMAADDRNIRFGTVTLK